MASTWKALALVAGTIAAIVAVIATYVGIDLVRSLKDIDRTRAAMSRVPVSDVEVDDLRLTGTSSNHYRMSGLVHNKSAAYTLTDVRFDVVVLDCVKGDCREQGRGRVEVIRRVPPNQATMFDTAIVTLPEMLEPLGERRFTTRVTLTIALP